MDCNQRMKKGPQHQASTDNKEKQPIEDSIEKVLPGDHTEECLTLHPPSTDVTQLPQRQYLGPPSNCTQPCPTSWIKPYRRKPGPSCLRKQGGGDREPTPGPQALKQGELNLATEKWFLEPNKVRFMDEPDTYRANVGRHREPQPRLMKAKTYPHLVFADPPASPDRETSKSPKERRAASNPPGEVSKATPDSTTIQKEPGLEMHEAPPVPLEPEVESIPHPGAPFPQKDDSDCEIVEPPMPFKPKKGWAKKRMEQTKKTLVLCIPRMDGPPVKREEAAASQMENPAPQAEGNDPGAGEAQEPQPDSGNGSIYELE